MHRSYRSLFAFFLTVISLIVLSSAAAAQSAGVASTPVTSTPAAAANTNSSTLPNAPGAQEPVGQKEKNPGVTTRQANKQVPKPLQQPKRILGLMPNYRAVSAGAIPPPPTAKEAFVMAGQNSFDYSSFVFTGLTSLIAEGEEAHPQLGKGVPGFWAYSWRGFVDKTDGNYLVMFALPSVFHEDERYYTLGEGPKFRRGVYAASRILITPNYHGHNTANIAELLGRGMAQGVSLSYYPSSDRTVGDFATKYAYALLRDAGTNAFREFWPDVANHFSHHHTQDISTQ